MVATPLVDKDIESGRVLLQRLDEDRFGVSAAYWFYEAEPDRWSLVIATPLMASKGPLAAYGRLVQSCRELAAESEGRFDFDSARVWLVREDDELLKALRRTLPIGRKAAGIRLSGSGIGGRLVEGAYIYRMERPLAA